MTGREGQETASIAGNSIVCRHMPPPAQKMNWSWRQITRPNSREGRRKTGLVREMAKVPLILAVSACFVWRYVR
jgi:hypothetical protein